MAWSLPLDGILTPNGFSRSDVMGSSVQLAFGRSAAIGFSSKVAWPLPVIGFLTSSGVALLDFGFLSWSGSLHF